MVITIIVLLILASVTIATLTGENGIITNALEARERTEIVSEVPPEWTNDQITPIYDGENGVIPLPDGFYYVGGTKSEGIVISDDPADEGKGTSHEVAQTLQGNQFVWVPVEIAGNFI